MITENKNSGSLKQYIFGFALSVILTIIAFGMVWAEMISGTSGMLILIGIAFIQFLVQIIFFMHIRDEEKPNWNLYSLVYVVIMVVILIVGSAWIMDSLHYNLMDMDSASHSTSMKH